MKQKELEVLKNMIFEERNKVLHFANFNNKLNDVDIDGDHVDKIQGNMLNEIHNKLSKRNSNRLNNLDNALQRIKDNCYGICEDCGEDIPYKRMLFNPCIITCICCAESRESEFK